MELVAHRAKVMEAQKDGRTMHALEFRRKYGIPPKEYQKRMKQLRELAGRNAVADPESRTTMHIFAVMWGVYDDSE